jgi:hypothetical protein
MQRKPQIIFRLLTTNEEESRYADKRKGQTGNTGEDKGMKGIKHMKNGGKKTELKGEGGKNGDMSNDMRGKGWETNTVQRRETDKDSEKKN